MTATTIDTNTIESLDFEYQPPCEVQYPNAVCNNRSPATWIATIVCCGRTVLMCDADRKNKLRFSKLKCTDCGIIHVPGRSGYLFMERL